jgi:hypothetical protein
MADINIERKRKSPLPWIIGLLALALLALLLMRTCGDDDDDAEAVVVTDTTTATQVAAPMDTTVMAAPMDSAGMATSGAAGATGAGTGWIAGILAGTAATAGTASGDGTVPETPSDRGFWIEENGQRVFAILQEPMEQIKDVDPGQRVRISNARVLRGSESAQIPQDVDAEAKRTAQGQQYFLLVPSSGVQIVSGGNTTPD